MEKSKPEITNCSLDTNVLLRWLLGDNDEQLKIVQQTLENPSIKKIHISDIVVAESVWVMQSVYKLDRNQITEALEILLNYPKFVLNKFLFKEVIPAFKAKTQVSFIDLMLVNYAKLNNSAPLLTFDKDLAKSFEEVVLLKEDKNTLSRGGTEGFGVV